MDASELQASLQALMDKRAVPAAPVQQLPDAEPAPLPQPEDPREVTAWELAPFQLEPVQPPADKDPFFEQYFSLAPQPAVETATDATTVAPALVRIEDEPDYLYFSQPIEQFPPDLFEEEPVKITPTANASTRAKRTAVQGLLVSVLIGIGGVLTALQASADIDWKLLGVSVGQAVLTALVSFLHNDGSDDATE
ncbi:hypothetical protein [Streptosporangium subroseum]|uniref:hypothetical protein n=1 Tax=Streptosporangium subroseum TaxID=106412 RepID=UPI00308555D4|nr:hypothetical protein OHB15_14090 [Streptosporangium subroseum]